MGKVELAYMGGIFDGEGYIGIRKSKGRYYILAVCLGMANEYIPNLFWFSFGGSIYKSEARIGLKAGLNRQCQWHWHIEARKARMFLETILPYLKLKRNEAELAVKFQGDQHYNYIGGKLSDEQLAVKEAQKILMSKMKIKQ